MIFHGSRMKHKHIITLSEAVHIRNLVGDADEQLLHDSLEGETDLFELVDELLEQYAEEDAQYEAIQNRLDALSVRKSSSKSRGDRIREALMACLQAGGLDSLRRPEGTLSLTDKKPSVESVDESLLPEQFFKTEKKVSKSAINEALKRGEIVPGITMSNGGPSLTVRRR